MRAFPLFPRFAPAFSGWRYFHITHSVVSVTFRAHLLLARWPNDRTFLGDTQVNAQYRQHRPASSVCPGCPVTCRQASTQARLSRPGTDEEGSLRACRPQQWPPSLALQAPPCTQNPEWTRSLEEPSCPQRAQTRGPLSPAVLLGIPPEQPYRAPCQRPAQPAARLLEGISAQWAWRPTASQADVMANSRHLAYLRDF